MALTSPLPSLSLALVIDVVAASFHFLATTVDSAVHHGTVIFAPNRDLYIIYASVHYNAVQYCSVIGP